MKKIIAAIFCVCTAVMLVLGIRYINSPLNSVPVEKVTHEDSISAQGFIARDERVYYARNTGTVYNHVAEGERVSTDSIVSTVYSGVISSDTIKELGTLDKNIVKERNAENRTSLYVSDSASVESEVSLRAKSIFDDAAEKNITGISKQKNDINKLRSGEELTDENSRLSQLEAQKKAIEDRIGMNKNEIFTEISGIFTTYLDGLEAVLKPDYVKDYTVDYIESLKGRRDAYSNISGSVKTGDPICKVVNNHVWYVIITADAASKETFDKNKNVILRFKNMTNAETSGTVSYISDEQNGKILVMIKCSQYMEGAFAYRNADVDVIFHSYTGYKVPVQAIRTSDGKHTVLAASGNKQCVCDCEILYSDPNEGIVIIESANGAQNKISKMDKIIIGER